MLWLTVIRESILLILRSLYYSPVHVCVCFSYLPWKLLLFVRKCRRYCGSPFLFTTQELMVRGGRTQQGIQLNDLWRRGELWELNILQDFNEKITQLNSCYHRYTHTKCILCPQMTFNSSCCEEKWPKKRVDGLIFIKCGFSGSIC